MGHRILRAVLLISGAFLLALGAGVAGTSSDAFDAMSDLREWLAAANRTSGLFEAVPDDYREGSSTSVLILRNRPAGYASVGGNGASSLASLVALVYAMADATTNSSLDLGPETPDADKGSVNMESWTCQLKTILPVHFMRQQVESDAEVYNKQHPLKEEPQV
ncbi:hypothetical protein BDY21DRAFT_362702 [Lineolata rhizophorae]|uniref:Uncharacterized protein n=1 Tax=Lineolata rhizophorae TaxID=578093 RepID=A0A6A6P5Z2_9PEZI|nr:hypothetical protein BDY21DRAFT_362702 [Lineolata rhizophorae]